MSKFTTTASPDQSQQPALDDTISQNHSSVIKECHSIISTGISELFPMFFSQVDDDLYKLSEKAETNTKQALLFEAMRYIRRERESIQIQYTKDLLLEYHGYWKKSFSTLRVVNTTDEANKDELSLIDEAVLEEVLAVNGMIEKGNAMHQSHLLPLNERFCFISGKEAKIDSLPVSPAVLCKQFSTIFKKLNVDLKIKLLIYKIFDRLILSKFGYIYENINTYLAASGVLPSISNKIKKQNSKTYADEAGLPAQLPTSYESAELSAYLETFRTMQSLMDNWRLQLGMSVFSSAAMSGAPIADSEDVISAINLLQCSSAEAALGDRPMSAESLKQHVALQLGKVQGTHLGRTIGRPEEDIIDMVGMIFDYILDDKSIPSSIKCLIVRLQIPIIKVAILDKTFFAKKNHASRVLLNELAQAGIGIIAEEANLDNPIIHKIEEIVTKILNEFTQDTTFFDGLLKDFSAFMEKESKRSMIAENRTLQTSQSKEKVWLAKKAVASEISLRLQNIEAPLFFRTFVYNDWKDVLLLAYLRRDKNIEEWKRSLEVLDKMIWSITPPANSQIRANLIQEIPSIVKAIRDGLESTSLDAHQIESLLKELEACHMSTLRRNPTFNRSDKPIQIKDLESILPTNDIKIKDAELAEAILEIKSQLPDIYNIDIEEVTMGSGEGVSRKKASDDFIQDNHMEAANHLKVGDWIGFMSDDGQLARAKLAWKSSTTSLCVFVNRRGVKVLELKSNDLALRMRQGRVNVIEMASIPLMDRAVSFLTQSLQNPFTKPVQSPHCA